jgi:nitrite reductase/ring-hydroxylating ferredoxin subunit
VKLIAIAAGMLAVLMAACQPQEGRVQLQPDEKFVIARGTWDYYQEYLQDIAGGGRGAFAVSEDGYYAIYQYCPMAQGCLYQINYSNEAIKSCQSKGYKCIVFAKDDEIVVPYEIAE